MSWYQPQKGKGKNTDVIAINYSEELQSRITEAVKGTKPSGDSKIKKPDFNLHLKEDCCKKILCDQTTVNHRKDVLQNQLFQRNKMFTGAKVLKLDLLEMSIKQ